MKQLGHEAKSAEKGLISALLAIEHDEDPRLGPGARAKAFKLNSSVFDDLRRFLDGF